MTQLHKAFCILLSLVVLSSCISRKTHLYQLQNPHQVPLFKEKNEARFTGLMGFGNDNQGLGAQTAYSVSDKFSVALNFMQNKNSKSESIDGVSSGHWSALYYDGAIGYYKDFKEWGVFETYAGFGYGTQEHSYSMLKEEWVNIWFFGSTLSQTLVPIGTADFITNRFYIQPNYGLSLNGIDIALSVRGTYLYFVSVTNKVTNGTSEYLNVKKIGDDREHYLIEPAITFKAGWKYVKGFMQFATTGFLGNNYLPISNSTFSFGLQFSFAPRFRKKNIESGSTSNVN